ncbi:uncharacterized protein LOC127284624 [Leptopilina boulardi]|uniref:uncharacterized protein LOC127284624 n=1 Tax=Leptopilina boulardi TaxID=63433 RepID=UPI0021F545FA|nr:uncharacterized protein LOC127284624 [Leptopilina boulardi]
MKDGCMLRSCSWRRSCIAESQFNAVGQERKELSIEREDAQKFSLIAPFQFSKYLKRLGRMWKKKSGPCNIFFYKIFFSFFLFFYNIFCLSSRPHAEVRARKRDPRASWP